MVQKLSSLSHIGVDISMPQYQQNVITEFDAGFLLQQIPLDGVPYHLQDAVVIVKPPIKAEDLEPELFAAFEDPQQQPGSRSFSYSSCASQAVSSQLHSSHRDQATFPITNLIFDGVPDRLSPSATSPSRKELDDDSQRTERRRAQNRAAQRAYRQRKDQSLKQRECEVEALQEELDKAKRLNKTLCKLVSLLREWLKDAPDVADGEEET